MKKKLVVVILVIICIAGIVFMANSQPLQRDDVGIVPYTDSA